MNHVAKYKEIASKGSRKYKKNRGGGGISGSRDRAVELCLQKLITSAPRNNQKQKFVAKYKGIASRSSRKYKKVGGGGSISGSRDRAVVVSQEFNYVYRN